MHIAVSAHTGGAALGADADGAVTLTELDEAGRLLGPPFTVSRDDFPQAVVQREKHSPRWVWDDTRRWYPVLLEAEVEVERCVDLRLCHTILRNAAATAESELARAAPSSWDAPSAWAEQGETDTLFDLGLQRGHDDEAQADPVEEFRLQRAAVAGSADPNRLSLLLAAESAGSLVAIEMQFAGLPWDASRHNELLVELLGERPPLGQRPARMHELLLEIRAALDDPAANPDSPVELVKSLRRAGIDVSSTNRWELARHEHPAIEPLLTYKKLSRLLTANGWNWIDTWVDGGRFRPVYVPGGVVTGRWAADGGGALQLPHQVRGAVIADPGWTFVVADAAQLEPRILTAMSGDRAMAAAGRDRDLYDGIVASGAVDTRAHAKVGMLGAMYGGTTGESGRMLPRLARAYPDAIRFVEEAARLGESGAVVSTHLGRTSPRPSGEWLELQDDARQEGASEVLRTRAKTARRSWGRFTRNFVVQGTAAEWALAWMAGLRRRLALLGPELPLRERPHLVFFLHDEIVVHTPVGLADAVAAEVRTAADEAGTILFGAVPVQFPVSVAIVDSYDKAKG
ncbi:bifunctional 3'-5' exonuclease/DNA polymerase [Agreia sp. VKM Ac-1783]|uniref:bifunctional 3'-5' exonuclease/DNA polymerase n=1 Tax=Agreia sp. VKM Ac-1783 TaxID=1938889 RepID=UPI000A2AA79E|nr:bifunctional 3'-5' exonuclease/DNA polymerase [Agreia sp. VKM Ac-1783]SMQ59785.1 DNA polymerase-1 [Agreia sp. VKM Ac-1783]